MPHDFGSFGSQDYRSGSETKSGIGFHELRQACEISALREDLERLAHEAGALRASVEEAVEEIRDRFAALSAAEMTDAAAIAPLLQYAVTTLLDIREQARRLNTPTGPLADDERPSWNGAADSARHRPAPPLATPAATPVAEAGVLRPTPVVPPEAPRPSRPTPALVAADVVRDGSLREAVMDEGAAPSSPASWLASKEAPPPPSRAATARTAGPSPKAPGGIDWLGPAGR